MSVFFFHFLVLTNPQLYTESKTIPMCNGYTCGDGTCVNGTRCDGVAQCDDGSDEVRCERQLSNHCSSNQYRCPSTLYFRSKCIPSSYRCNGDRDCSDGSDERNCPSVSTCHTCYSSSTYTYLTYGRLICSTRCDGNTECSDGSDEEYCHSGTIHEVHACSACYCAKINMIIICTIIIVWPARPTPPLLFIILSFIVDYKNQNNNLERGTRV